MISADQAKTVFLEMGLEILPCEWTQIQLYTELLWKWNSRINLTRITSEEKIYREHFGESFFLSGLLPEGCRNVLDVGSGAGFPALALKIKRPRLGLTLVESSGKKAQFLAEVARQLGWKREVEVLNARWEDVEASTEREYEAISLRGLRAAPPLISSLARHLRGQGRLLLSTSAQQADRVESFRCALTWERDSGFWPISKRVVLVGRRCST